MGLGSFPGGAEEQHVEAKLLRPLTQNEKAYVKALLDEAARAIVSEVETPVDKWSEEFTARAGDVQAALVARRLRNPEASMRAESDGQYRYSYDTTNTAGDIELTDRDRRRLGLRPGLFFRQPQYGKPGERSVFTPRIETGRGGFFQ